MFADTILAQKYLWAEKGEKTWEEVAHRVTKSVLRAAGITMRDSRAQEIFRLINEKIFMPGGRYLYASGRPFHQVQNCLLLRAEDSREGWSDLLSKASMALMTGAGIGVDYSTIRSKGSLIRKTGGVATGPIALMQMINEVGRGVMQGGSRRSAIWAGLNWRHRDVLEFLRLKDWPSEVRKLKESNFNFPATMDGTNISVQLDDEFFRAYHDEKHTLHDHAHVVYWETLRRMLKTAEPGFSIDTGRNAKETLRNAPVSADTYVLTDGGYVQVRDIIDKPTTLWTGVRWAEGVTFKRTQKNAEIVEVSLTGGRSIKCEPKHEFIVERYTGVGVGRRLASLDRVKACELEEGDICHTSYPEYADLPFNSQAYTLGFVYGDGSFHTKYPRAELSLCTEDKKACLARMDMSMITSVTSDDTRGYTRIYFQNSDWFEGCSKEQVHERFFTLTPGGIASFLAGLFDADGNYGKEGQRIRLGAKHRGFLRDVSRMLETLGIKSNINVGSESGYSGNPTWTLVVLSEDVPKFGRVIPSQRLRVDAEGYEAYRPARIKVEGVERLLTREDVFCCDVGYAEHSFMAEGVIISNCTEVCSADDSDICNLGSINLARVGSIEEMRQVVALGTLFLLAGTLYSDVPYAKVDQVRTKNRRLGLGLMGLHEWLLLHGKQYGPDAELAKYLEVYTESNQYAREYADEWGISCPIKTRAIAPTGTIGILAQTTTGIEPIFCSAYKRRYLKHTTWNYQYVIDPTAKRLVEELGVSPEAIEDAYSISTERRVSFQAWVQGFVDHAISSTINLPAWGTETNNENTVRPFGEMLLTYLPSLRGVTCYPDGARGGQPLTPIKYTTAQKHQGEVFVEATDICDITKGGSCGS